MSTKTIVNYFFLTALFLCLTEAFGQNKESVYPQGYSINRSNSTATVVLDSSNLPIIMINTNSQTIIDGTKITAQMKIINNEPLRRNYVTDSANVYNGYVGIEIRGSFSATLPQKPYGFETRDSLGNNNNVPIMNMPAENDWVLIANYNDKVFMRNTLAFDLFANMGHYQPHTRICEVVVNGEYEGIYVLTEKIKVDKNRVDISKLTAADTSGNNLTGGYIIKVDNTDGSGTDFWNSTDQAFDRPGSYPYFVYTYPKPADIVDQQKKYIQGFVSKIDSILKSPNWADPTNGYRKYFDVESFVDYFIVGEVSRNVDTYKKSAYFYKNKDSKDVRLHAGPIWDFDWAWKNINECEVNAIDGSGWTYLISSVCQSYPIPPGWMNKFLQDTNFTNELHTRFSLLRQTILSETTLNHYVDSIHTLVNEAQVRHYQRWPILGINVGTPEVDAEPTTFDGEIAKFKNWISTRLNWLDANMPGKDIQVTSVQSTVTRPKDFVLYQNYPNPFNPTTVIHYYLPVASHAVVKVYDVLGREVATLVNEQKSAGLYQVTFDAHLLTSGVYFYSLQAGTFTETKKLVLIK
jgi:CotH kinase protein/Secretion system C-terminal sorting domain